MKNDAKYTMDDLAHATKEWRICKLAYEEKRRELNAAELLMKQRQEEVDAASAKAEQWEAKVRQIMKDLA